MIGQSKFHKFMRTARLVKVNSNELLETIGLYAGQPPLLFLLLEEDGLSRKELANQLMTQPATITKMIQRLENNGFVESRQAVNDSRVSLVYLTDKGREIEDSVNSVLNSMEALMFKGFSEDEITQFESYIDRIENNIRRLR